MLYCSFIPPYMTYCLEVWGKTYKTITNPFLLLQKRAIRIVNTADYCEPTNKLFIHLQALRFNKVLDFKLASLMYKANNSMLPD